jgi:hypothetical protein
MGRVDHVAFASRGGGTISCSDYEFCQTSCCGAWCVEERELSDLYFDGTNISAVLSLLRQPSEKDPPCPLCGAQAWDLRPIEDPEQAPDAWQWAVTRP